MIFSARLSTQVLQGEQGPCSDAASTPTSAWVRMFSCLVSGSWPPAAGRRPRHRCGRPAEQFPRRRCNCRHGRTPPSGARVTVGKEAGEPGDVLSSSLSRADRVGQLLDTRSRLGHAPGGAPALLGQGPQRSSFRSVGTSTPRSPRPPAREEPPAASPSGPARAPPPRRTAARRPRRERPAQRRDPGLERRAALRDVGETDDVDEVQRHIGTAVGTLPTAADGLRSRCTSPPSSGQSACRSRPFRSSHRRLAAGRSRSGPETRTRRGIRAR